MGKIAIKKLIDEARSKAVPHMQQKIRLGLPQREVLDHPTGHEGQPLRENPRIRTTWCATLLRVHRRGASQKLDGTEDACGCTRGSQLRRDISVETMHLDTLA
jgi:hypothetical protein